VSNNKQREVIEIQTSDCSQDPIEIHKGYVYKFKKEVSIDYAMNEEKALKAIVNKMYIVLYLRSKGTSIVK
jgi:hypothetical protein